MSYFKFNCVLIDSDSDVAWGRMSAVSCEIESCEWWTLLALFVNVCVIEQILVHCSLHMISTIA